MISLRSRDDIETLIGWLDMLETVPDNAVSFRAIVLTYSPTYEKPHTPLFDLLIQNPTKDFSQVLGRALVTEFS